MQRHETMAWMLAEAVEQLERAHRQQRQRFRQELTPPLPSWEPLLDMVASATGLSIVIALPGVAAQDIEVLLEDATLTVRGTRALGAGLRGGEILRLEVPYGRFERRIALTDGPYRIGAMQLQDGCLRLHLEARPRHILSFSSSTLKPPAVPAKPIRPAPRLGRRQRLNFPTIASSLFRCATWCSFRAWWCRLRSAEKARSPPRNTPCAQSDPSGF